MWTVCFIESGDQKANQKLFNSRYVGCKYLVAGAIDKKLLLDVGVRKSVSMFSLNFLFPQMKWKNSLRMYLTNSQHSGSVASGFMTGSIFLCYSSGFAWIILGSIVSVVERLGPPPLILEASVFHIFGAGKMWSSCYTVVTAVENSAVIGLKSFFLHGRKPACIRQHWVIPYTSLWLALESVLTRQKRLFVSRLLLQTGIFADRMEPSTITCI